MPIRYPFIARCAVICAAAVYAHAVNAWEFKGVEMHGAISATAAYSGEYNYLGDTKESPDLNVLEGIFNAQYRFDFGLRAAAQVYAYRLDDHTAVVLDYGNLSYSFTDWFGISVGRNKRPYGLYGEIQDIDIVHPFAFLPLANIRKDFRTLVAAVDGIQAFGTINLKSAGSLDYKIYAGWEGEVDPESYFVRSLSGLSEADFLEPGFQYGGSLFYNTPIQGLRVGASIAIMPHVRTKGTVHPRKELYYQSSETRYLGEQIDGQFTGALVAAGLPQQAIDFLYGEDYSYFDNNITGRRVYTESELNALKLSAEYTKDPFLFAVEYGRTATDSEQTGVLSGTDRTVEDGFFAMATWKATPKLEFGAYADFAWKDESDRSGKKLKSLPSHTAYTQDYAVAASYKIKDWWTIKAEYHLINGTGLISNAEIENGDPSDWKRRWNYFVVKTTLSF